MGRRGEPTYDHRVVSDQPPTNGVRYQLSELGRRVDNLERNTENLRVIEERVKSLQRVLDKEVNRRLNDLDNDVSGLRRALYTAALGITGSAILFSATIFSVFQ
jgi:hypothetical protein